MKTMVRLLLGLLVVTSSMSGAAAQEPVKAINVVSIAQSGYDVNELRMLAAMFQDFTGIEVKIAVATYAELFSNAAEFASKNDVFCLDQLWLADFATKGLLSPLDEYISKKMQRDIAPAVLKAFQYQNKIWAWPFLVNFQLFFYNETMLTAAGFKTPPTSLETLIEQMKTMKTKGIVEYPWTDAWSQTEGLISEYVWLTGAFGGEIFDDEGQPIFDQKSGVTALKFMVMLLKEQLAHPSILTNNEIVAKDDFISGQAAFTSNWIFQSGFLDAAGMADILKQGKMGLLPVSERVSVKTSSVSGFQGIGISAASTKQEAAWKWIKFFTSPLVQRAYRYEMPIWTSVQTSPDLNMLDPTLAIKREQLGAVHHRPNIPNYPAISSILQSYLHIALEGKMEPSMALKRAKAEIEENIATK